jgi:hypothetical protein
MRANSQCCQVGYGESDPRARGEKKSARVLSPATNIFSPATNIFFSKKFGTNKLKKVNKN